MTTEQDTFGSEAITRGVRVEVSAFFDPHRSDPAQGLWFFLYTVTISNESEEVVQLTDRHWIITDQSGRVEEVQGPAVVGEQPILAPGESFEYTSGCPLRTATGRMRGTYRMVAAEDDSFDAEIAEFFLSEPLPVN